MRLAREGIRALWFSSRHRIQTREAAEKPAGAGEPASRRERTEMNLKG